MSQSRGFGPLSELFNQAWRRYPPPGWPFRDEPRILRPGPFTCLFLIILIPVLILTVPLIWRSVFPSPSSAPTLEPRYESLISLSAGACFSGWNPLAPSSRPLQTEVRVIDCAQPHQSELMMLTFYMSGLSMPTKFPDTYPGREALEADANRSCALATIEYVGVDPSLSQLVISYALPTPEDWQFGGRSIRCIASFPNGDETGSVRGSRR